MARLKERYKDEIVPHMMGKFGYKNTNQVPKIEKIILSMGLGEAKQNSNMLEAATEQLATIAGQQPNVRIARKSIAGFKLRDGMPVGIAVTLRRERMYEMLDRLISIAIPRFRDFRGLNPRSFDGRGNYSLGINEQIVFPEIDYDAIDQIRGLNFTVTTTAASDEEAYELLSAFGMPFRGELPGKGPTKEEQEQADKEREEREARAAAEQEARAELQAESGEGPGDESSGSEDGDSEVEDDEAAGGGDGAGQGSEVDADGEADSPEAQ